MHVGAALFVVFVIGLLLSALVAAAVFAFFPYILAFVIGWTVLKTMFSRKPTRLRVRRARRQTSVRPVVVIVARDLKILV